MTALNKDALAAAMEIWYGGDPLADGFLERVITAYLSALPAPDSAGLIAEARAVEAERKLSQCLKTKNELVLKAYPAMDERDELQRQLAAAREALKPFAMAQAVVEMSKLPFLGEDTPFPSGCAWRENGEKRTLTFGDFYRARAALSAAPAPVSGEDDGEPGDVEYLLGFMRAIASGNLDAFTAKHAARAAIDLYEKGSKACAIERGEEWPPAPSQNGGE